MGDLKDKIQIGDKVTYELDGLMYEEIYDSTHTSYRNESIKILKIERPTYEVVAEVKKEKKELLSECDRDFLKNLVHKVENVLRCEVKSFFIIRVDNLCRVNFRGEDFKYLGELVTTETFDNLKEETTYTLVELGLV